MGPVAFCEICEYLAYFIEEVNSRLAKPPLSFSGDLGIFGLITLVKQATERRILFIKNLTRQIFDCYFAVNPKDTVYIEWMYGKTLQWRHDERDGVSNHQPHDCLLNRSFRCRSKRNAKLRVTGLCEGNSPVRLWRHTQHKQSEWDTPSEILILPYLSFSIGSSE